VAGVCISVSVMATTAR